MPNALMNRHIFNPRIPLVAMQTIACGQVTAWLLHCRNFSSLPFTVRPPCTRLMYCRNILSVQCRYIHCKDMHRHSVFVYFRIDSFNYNSFVQSYPYFGNAYSSLYFTYNTASQHIQSLAYLSKDGDDLFADRLPCIILIGIVKFYSTRFHLTVSIPSFPLNPTLFCITTLIKFTYLRLKIQLSLHKICLDIVSIL